MQSIELTKPITTEALLKEFESRFNQTMDLNKFTREELEDTANKVRTKIHNINKNEHFGEEPTQVVILITTEEGTTQVFKKNKVDYLPKLKEAVENFYKWIEEKNVN